MFGRRVKDSEGLRMNYITLPNEFNGVTCRAVVEVTRGTQLRREVENNSPSLFPVTKIFETPFLANYGFIPSTLDGDGDCLDCYVVGDAIQITSVVIVYPRLCIDYIDKDGQDYKIVSVLDPTITDAEVQTVAEAICRAMGLQVTSIRDKEFAMRVIKLTSV